MNENDVRKELEITKEDIENAKIPDSEYKEKVEVSRIRRITGYLVGTTKQFNDAKFDEMSDRTKHTGHIGLQADKNIEK